jgi:hypothetical protein
VWVLFRLRLLRLALLHQFEAPVVLLLLLLLVLLVLLVLQPLLLLLCLPLLDLQSHDHHLLMPRCPLPRIWLQLLTQTLVEIVS